jgi:hypothetical protein
MGRACGREEQAATDQVAVCRGLQLPPSLRCTVDTQNCLSLIPRDYGSQIEIRLNTRMANSITHYSMS